MAASDQTYRNQTTLHLVFAVSSVAMLATTVWMFWDDYNRPFKKEQRTFRDVEEEMAKRALLATAPDETKRGDVVQAEKALAEAREVHYAVRRKADDQISALQTEQFKDEKKLADVKADFDSLMSYFNIEVELHGPAAEGIHGYRERMDTKAQQMAALKLKVEDTQAKIQDVNRTPIKVQVNDKDVEVAPEKAATNLSDAEDVHKKKTDEFDRFAKLAAQKQWKMGDWVRALPVIDGFASPMKIQQYTLDELPIDYSFKFVTRYDRCTTCHQGMDKASYDKASLLRLRPGASTDAELTQHLENARQAIDERNRIITAYNRNARSSERKDPLPVDLSQLQPRSLDLSDARINEYAAHPRLDLYVDANSKHPIEKFGCSACHGGQGSATTFVDATHTPNDTLIREYWANSKEHRWQSIHFWDFPMLPKRFAEAGCVKCHHQIEGLIRDTTDVAAPTLVQGYTLVSELGCFGCHEISGQKSGRWVGPDLRLEPDPPLESLSPEEKVKRLADTANPPGTMRKVGPSLARIAEKTHEEWVRQWIKSPRDFRPDTRMPHYYRQANNQYDALKDTKETTSVDQSKFPDAEAHSIAYYLMQTSRNLLREVGERAKDGPEARAADAKAVEDLTAKLADAKTSDDDKKQAARQLAAVKARIAARSQPLPVDQSIQLPPPPADDKARADQIDRGRHLVSSKGCLACHQHGGTESAKAEAQPPLPAISGESFFGPNLSRLASKIGNKANDPQSGRKWLVQWLLNPKVHSPRTKMPSVQLTDSEADDIASWLLSQQSDWKSIAEVNTETLVTPDKATLKALARIWLAKSETGKKLTQVIDEDKGFSDADLAGRPDDAFERVLTAPLDEGKLKMYIGKKAINNLGCFGCHNIPGFENAKPIGTPLNEWGKKDPARIEYADAARFVHESFHIVDARRDLTKVEREHSAKPWEFEKGKPPYETFFADGLHHEHQTREAFFHLKLQEPRSYDFNRIKNWEDRLRMPQFKFARSKPLAKNDGESDEAYKQRFELEQTKAEAEGREAVMTFILGLVAEPVPAKYVYTPSGDRLAEIKGRAVIEKFNCAGCHLLAAGHYEFKLANYKYEEVAKQQDGKEVKEPVSLRDAVLNRLESKYADYKNDNNNYGADHRFPEHNAWAGMTQPKDRLIAQGVLPEFIPDDNDDKKKNLLLRLTHGLRFTNKDGVDRDLPAFTEIIVPAASIDDPRTRSVLGGSFGESLAKYLQARDAMQYSGEDKSHAAVPPSLLREGEKVQAGWLFQFLKNPLALRPMTVLRMPNFGMSDDDAMALVNYFAAVDKANNPGIGLTYPYFAVPQREPGYMEKMTGEYVDRLRKANLLDARIKEYQPVWAEVIRGQVADAEGAVKAAQARLAAAKQSNMGVAEAEKAVAAAEDELKALRQRLETNEFKDLQQAWERREAYVTEAFRLVSNSELCLKCHSVGTIKAAEQQGPPLNYAAERLRPEWALRWISNPQRFLPYKSVMPMNFPANAESNPYAGAFIGSEKGFTDEQIKACRDSLMIYPQVADWPVLKHRPGTGATGGK